MVVFFSNFGISSGHFVPSVLYRAMSSQEVWWFLCMLVIRKQMRNQLWSSHDEANLLLLALLVLVCYNYILLELLLAVFSVMPAAIIVFYWTIYIEFLTLASLFKIADITTLQFLSWYQSFRSKVWEVSLFSLLFLTLSLYFSWSKHGLYFQTIFFYLWFDWIWTKLNHGVHSFLSDAQSHSACETWLNELHLVDISNW